ncbi:MAG: recombinase family protein [Christensenella sp.]|uniref:recombinase family protein n=1 Tax=Christensenella sp. TaxID=1935934 RepID=UPI002B1EC8D4|nr:recombinase family protein [Christensenella sp.]MEA5004728.1 recombinase family protein [Christensenella sp.]
MNGVIYARYSSDSQREESIEGQIRECMEFAEQKGITILGSYVDRALSAKTDNRPEFQRMIKDSAKGLFEIVLVWKLDRFARDRYDSAHYKMILRKNGAKVVSAKENISDGPEGIILESMLEGYAEYYSAELSEKIVRGQKENALKGKYNGGALPLGYTTNSEQNYLIDAAAASIVREIFTRYADGETVKEICDTLNSRGIMTQRNRPFNKNSLHTMLKNRRYIGEYRYRDVVIPDGVPVIIHSELFERVQERLDKNKKAPAREKAKINYLLTTKLFCGKCGAYMVGESGTGRNGKHYYYKCTKVKQHKGCDKKSVKKGWIEDFVVLHTMKYALSDDTIDRMADEVIQLQKQENLLLPSLRQQLADTQKGIENMLNAIQQGVLTSSTKQRLDELEVVQEDLKLSILQAELEKPLLSKEKVVFWISRFKDGDTESPAFRQRLIDSFVNSVYLFDDKVVLTYNYKDGSQTVTLAEIQAFLEQYNGSDLNGCAPPIKWAHHRWVYFIA